MITTGNVCYYTLSTDDCGVAGVFESFAVLAAFERVKDTTGRSYIKEVTTSYFSGSAFDVSLPYTCRVKKVRAVSF
jgi:hypothetical protein